MSSGSPELVELGVFLRPHGIRGSLIFRPHNPDSDALASIRSIGVGAPPRTYAVKQAREAGQGWIVDLDGVTTRDAAEALAKAPVFVDSKLLPPPDEDEFYYRDVIGAPVVTRSGARIGRVVDVTFTSTDVLQVARDDGGELWVPVVPDYVLELETEPPRVVVVDDAVELLDFS